MSYSLFNTISFSRYSRASVVDSVRPDVVTMSPVPMYPSKATSTLNVMFSVISPSHSDNSPSPSAVKTFDEPSFESMVTVAPDSGIPVS